MTEIMKTYEEEGLVGAVATLIVYFGAFAWLFFSLDGSLLITQLVGESAPAVYLVVGVAGLYKFVTAFTGSLGLQDKVKGD